MEAKGPKVNVNKREEIIKGKNVRVGHEVCVCSKGLGNHTHLILCGIVRSGYLQAAVAFYNASQNKKIYNAEHVK